MPESLIKWALEEVTRDHQSVTFLDENEPETGSEQSDKIGLLKKLVRLQYFQGFPAHFRQIVPVRAIGQNKG